VTAVAIALTVAAGLAGAVQAAVMGELGERVGVFPALAFSGIVALVISVALLLVAKQSLRGLGDVVREPFWLWTGGGLSILIILAITVGAPRIGVAPTIGIVIALNLVGAALIDHFGLFGYESIPMTSMRVLGLLLLGAGAALSLSQSV
jgi:bacterial/archaeal transporter family-2 protein